MLFFPKDKMQLAAVLEDIVGRGVSARNHWRIHWHVNHAYLQGYRKFFVSNMSTGTVIPGIETEDGRLLFRFDDVTEQFQRELGQLSGINVAPSVEPVNRKSLDGFRGAAVAGVYLDHVMPSQYIDTVKRTLLSELLTYGTVGLGVVLPDGVKETRAYLETIPPWQLFPIPAAPSTPEDIRGIARFRWVPYKSFKAQYEHILNFPRSTDESQLQLRHLPHGSNAPSAHDDPVDEGAGFGGVSLRSSLVPGRLKSGRGGDTDESFVAVTEVWAYDRERRLTNTYTMLGTWIADSMTWEPKKGPLCPVTVVSTPPVEGFYGWPWLSSLIPLALETERMLASLFKNVQELDQFGLVVLPANAGIKRTDLMGTGRPRIAFAQPDFTGQQRKIEHVQPLNSGDAPGRVVSTAVQLLDRMGRNSPLYRGEMPGRAESAVAGGLLFETANISRKPTLIGIDEAISNTYRCIIDHGRRTGFAGNLDMSIMDDSVAGLTVKPGTLEVSLEENPLPDVSELLIHIQERTPKMQTQQRQELLTMLQAGIIDMKDFVWISYKEGMGYPVGNEDIIEQYKVGMWRNIQTFGDGKTPGGVQYWDHDDHEIQVRVLQRFMRTGRYGLASKEVWEKFEERLAFHTGMLSGNYPDQLPYQEDQAAMNMQNGMGRAPQGGPGGGGVPPEMLAMLGGQGGGMPPGT